MSILTRRLVIFFFYDGEGIVDDYVPYLLTSLRPFVDRIVFVSNGSLTKTSEVKARTSSDQLLIRKNIGFDVWAYKEAIEHVGFEEIGSYDELILMNHTCYGPIFPFSEMFEEMERRSDDFWGISIHKALTPNPYTGVGSLPAHIQSHFIAVRKPMLQSAAFVEYWRTMEPINSYDDSVQKHESRFTQHFSRLGYTHSAYLDPDAFHTPYPIFIEVDRSLDRRVPILKRRLFFHDPQFQENVGVSFGRTLRRLGEVSDYDPALIWKNIVRETKPRPLMTNAGNLRILDDEPNELDSAPLRLAVLAHVSKGDSVELLHDFLARFPEDTSVLVTTESSEIAAGIVQRWSAPEDSNRTVRVARDGSSYGVASLVDKDTMAWLREGQYDVVCRFQDYFTDFGYSLPQAYEDHTIDATANSAGYVTNVIGLFAATPWLGLVFPPFRHVGMIRWPNFAHTAGEILSELGVSHRPDTVPLAPQFGVFWFRPQALQKMFSHDWSRSHIDRDRGTAVLQSLVSVAASSSYTTMEVMPKSVAQQTYVRLDYREIEAQAQRTVRSTAKELIHLVRVSLKHRYPRLFRVLRPMYLLVDPLVRRVLR